jgi:hypothetical protein
MRSAAARAELPAWCSIHNLFVKEYRNPQGEFTFGCPKCVEASKPKRRKRGRPSGRKCVVEATGLRQPE